MMLENVNTAVKISPKKCIFTLFQLKIKKIQVTTSHTKGESILFVTFMMSYVLIFVPILQYNSIGLWISIQLFVD